MAQTIRLATTGDVDETVVQQLQADLAETGLSVERGEAVGLVDADRDRRRDQYRSSMVIHHFPDAPPEEFLLVLTRSDIYAGSLNFVFGQSDYATRRAVVSLARMVEHPVTGPATPEQVRQRLLVETLHELGHLRGLEHCDDPSCAMHFAFSLYETDRKTPAYCDRCSALLL